MLGRPLGPSQDFKLEGARFDLRGPDDFFDKILHRRQKFLRKIWPKNDCAAKNFYKKRVPPLLFFLPTPASCGPHGMGQPLELGYGPDARQVIIFQSLFSPNYAQSLDKEGKS
jgi:hypothetical protein